MENKRYPIPPFTVETALQKVQAAEDAWNTKDPEKVSQAYSVDTEWRNRTDFINGREEVKAFLTRKWQKELDYKLKKELWGFRENRMAVRFEYEWRDQSGQWFRSYGNELWEFDENGYMKKRFASINDLPIEESQKKIIISWPEILHRLHSAMKRSHSRKSTEAVGAMNVWKDNP